MRRIAYTTKHVEQLARLMRAEALSDGAIGMLLVGGVGGNRVLADCDTFERISDVNRMVNQSPGGFESVKSTLFYSRPRTSDKRLAKSILDGRRFEPGTNSLYFYAPKADEKCKDEWFGAEFVGKYKSHCFYSLPKEVCPNIY